jgi:hypothetical protein
VPRRSASRATGKTIKQGDKKPEAFRARVFSDTRRIGKSTGSRRLDGALGTPVLSFCRWPTISADFLRSRILPCIRSHIRSWPVVFGPVIAVGTANLRGRIRPFFKRPVRLPVSRRRSDFEFVQLVPLFIGAIPLRDRRQFANPTTRIDWLWIIHGDIMTHTAVLIQYSRKKRTANNLKTIDSASLSAL